MASNPNKIGRKPSKAAETSSPKRGKKWKQAKPRRSKRAGGK